MSVIPPNDTPMEAALLSAVMVDGLHLEAVCALPEDAFYVEANRRIYRAIKSLYTKGLDVDLVAVHSELNGAIDDFGGVSYLAGLDDGNSYGTHILTYLARVKQVYGYRQMLIATQKLAVSAQSQTVGDADVIGAMDALTVALSGINGTVYTPQAEKHTDSWDDMLGGVSGTVQRQTTPSGYKSLDEIIGGFDAGTFSVLGARPSMGKTSFALGITNVAKSGKKVLFFSLETPQKALNQRLLADATNISANRIKHGQLTPSEAVRVAVASVELMNLPIIVIDDARVTVADIARAVALHQPDIVIIDYLQLLTGAEKSGNREQEIAGISRGIKYLRMQSNAAFVVLSQLSRAVETRPNHRPMLSDLRESGAIEQDANIVMFLYRDEHYNPESEHQGIAEVIVAKNRDGEIGTAKLSWDASRTRFSDLN